MSHPYSDLPSRAFWRTAVAEADRDRFAGLYLPRFGIDPGTRVATAGSCFAQHIATYLRAAGCRVLNAEPAPRGMPPAIARRFQYGIYSARYGNIYTARQMRQLLEEVVSGTPDMHIWSLGDHFVDGLRPTVEPDGLLSRDEVTAHRRFHLHRLRGMLERTDVFVFTLGLTEAWADRETGRVFPTCPGVAGGTFDAEAHVFCNFTQSEVLADLHVVQDLLQQIRPGIEMLLTVSPVPLTATASDEHVLAATTYSKSVLRAAAGEFVAATDDTDYFPSYEIVTAPASGGPWFTQNMRQVSPEGVEKVMSIFLTAHGLIEAAPPSSGSSEPAATSEEEEDDAICDEVLLQAFAK